MKKYLRLFLILSFVLVLSMPGQYLQAVTGTSDPSATGKITCFSRSSVNSAQQGVEYTFTIGTDAYFVSSGNSMAYSYSDDPTAPKSPHVNYSYGNKTNRLVLTGTGYYVDLTKLLTTILFTNNLATVDKASKKLVTFDQTVSLSSSLPSCTGPTVYLPTPPAPPTPPSSSGNTANPETCTDGIKNQNETTVDHGGICSTAAELGNCSDKIKNGNETGLDEGGRCGPGELGPIGPGSHEAPFGYWPSSTKPVRISVDNYLVPLYAQFVPKALRDWNLATPIVVTEGGPDSIRVSITNGNYGNTGWVGITNVSLNGNQIQNAPVRVNDFYMNTSYYNNDLQRQYVVTHELGHAWGLGHQDTAFSNPNMGSVMDYTDDIDGSLKSQVTNLHPNENDLDGLLHIYP